MISTDTKPERGDQEAIRKIQLRLQVRETLKLNKKPPFRKFFSTLQPL